MTNINCSSNCIYQQDGKCSLNKSNVNILTPFSNCAYFIDAHNSNNNN